jgi:hypothetical protein
MIEGRLGGGLCLGAFEGAEEEWLKGVEGSFVSFGDALDFGEAFV